MTEVDTSETDKHRATISAGVLGTAVKGKVTYINKLVEKPVEVTPAKTLMVVAADIGASMTDALKSNIRNSWVDTYFKARTMLSEGAVLVFNEAVTETDSKDITVETNGEAYIYNM